MIAVFAVSYGGIKCITKLKFEKKKDRCVDSYFGQLPALVSRLTTNNTASHDYFVSCFSSVDPLLGLFLVLSFFSFLFLFSFYRIGPMQYAKQYMCGACVVWRVQWLVSANPEGENQCRDGFAVFSCFILLLPQMCLLLFLSVSSLLFLFFSSYPM